MCKSVDWVYLDKLQFCGRDFMKTAIHRRGFYSKILGGCFNDCKLSNEAFPSVRGEFESNGEWYHNCVNILKLLVSWSYFLMNF